MANKYGKAVNEAVKARLKEYGFENDQQARWMVIGLAFDILKIMQNHTGEERRAQTRFNEISRAAFDVTEGLNPDGPKYF